MFVFIFLFFFFLTHRAKHIPCIPFGSEESVLHLSTSGDGNYGRKSVFAFSNETSDELPSRR